MVRIALPSCLRHAALPLALVTLAASAQSPTPHSGFLDNYDGLGTAANVASAVSWVKPGVDWKRYTTVALDPLELWWSATAQYRGMRADTIAAIADAYRQSVTRALSPGYKVIASAPRLGANTLRLRCALTGLDPQRPQPRPINFVPAMAAVSLVRAATGNQLYTLSLVAECEALDGTTGERLYAVVATRTASRVDLNAPLSGMAMQTLIDGWAAEVRTLLDKASGRAVTAASPSK